MHFTQVSPIQVRANLSTRNIRMAEHCLYSPQVSAAQELMSSK